MRIELHTADLKSALTELALFSPKRTAIKELEYVRMVATEGNGLQLYTNDLSSSLLVTIDSVAVHRSGIALVELATLQNVVKNSDTALVSLDVISGKLHIDGFKLPTLDPDSYPDGGFELTDHPVSVSVLTKDLHSLMTRVKHASAASVNTVQGYPGVRLTAKDHKLTCATQDGWRLAESNIDVTTRTGFSVLVDMHYVSALCKILPCDKYIQYVDIKVHKNRFEFTWNHHKAIIKKGEGNFMDYEGFFPRDFSEFVDVDRKDLIAKIKKAGVIAKDIGYRIQLSTGYNHELSISTKTDKAEMETTVQTGVNIMPDGRSVALNGQFLLDTLNSIDSEMVTLAWAGEEMPVYVCPSGMYTHDRDVIMSLTLR